MDQVTQQNAAMVEETSAATHKLSAEADGLVHLIARFKLSDDAERRWRLSATRRKPDRLTGPPGDRQGRPRLRRQCGRAEQSWKSFEAATRLAQERRLGAAFSL